MKIKGVVDEDFINYKLPSMYISTNTCTFKCEKECGVNCCQNSQLAQSPDIDISTIDLAERYVKNKITKAIVFGGLEPFDSFDDVAEFVLVLREQLKCDDPVVIYTGYDETEVLLPIQELKRFKNVIIKFGRFIPNQENRFDEVLGVTLASPNQYAKQIS